MIFVLGTLNYGTVERSARHRIVTRFIHLFFMPLIPIGSRVKLIHPVQLTHPISIKLNWSSVFAAYVRTWGVVLLVASGYGCTQSMGDLSYEPSHYLFHVAVRRLLFFSIICATVLAGYFLLGRTTPERKLQLACFGTHTDLEVDPRFLRQGEREVGANLQKWITDRCHGQGQTGYRSMPDPEQEWMQIALDPANHDREVVGAAYTLARLRGSHGSHADRRSFRAAEQALWQKFLQLQARDTV
jgi:hypothetical protein